MTTLTRRQIARQDFVDNRIFEMINSLPPSSRQIEWDIELIGDVRDFIYAELAKRSPGLDERRFYPFIDTDRVAGPTRGRKRRGDVLRAG